MRRKLAAALAAFLFLLPAVKGLEGMDISVYQGAVDLAAAQEAGVSTVYIRSSFGPDGVDPDFRQNARLAAQTGVDFGFYHFLEAGDPQTAAAEARHFARTIAATGYTCRPALDFEVDAGLTAGEKSAVVRAFLTALEEATAARPMLYVDVSNARQMAADLGEYPLWVAEYDVSAPDLARTPWSGYAGWQYSDAGEVPGVPRRVDRDVFTQAVLLREGEKAHAAAVPRSYTVRAGDTLTALARRYHTTVAALVALNAIPDPNLIYIGQSLRLPGAQGDDLYTVRPGDTLTALALRYGTTVLRLVRTNHIQDPNLIYVGQVLTV